MKKRKYLVQRTLTIAAIASMGTTLALTSPSLASANQISTSGEQGVLAENTPPSIIEQANAVGITDVKSELDKIGKYYYVNEIAGTQLYTRVATITFKPNPDSVETEIDFSITGSNVDNLNYDTTILEYVTIGELDNTKTPVEQTLTTPSYSKSTQETISTATQNGFKVGGAGDLLFGVPLLVEGLKINAEFNSSTTSTKVESEAKTITLPSQNIKVPPGKKYKAVVSFKQLNFWGDVSFTGEGINPMTTIKGTGVYYAPNGSYWEQHTWRKYTALFWKELTNAQKNDLNGIEFIYYPSTGGVRVKAQGTSRFEGVMGSKLEVDILDVTNPASPMLVETRSF
ncbi:ETX/MTX2 family pore-forming toxin [Lysinibacillus sp. fkY74-1]